jgi:hypothetical protein
MVDLFLRLPTFGRPNLDAASRGGKRFGARRSTNGAESAQQNVTRPPADVMVGEPRMLSGKRTRPKV